MGKPLDEYTDAEWEEEKAEARERIDAEAAARPTPSFMERLAELARELEPDMEGICTADQLLSGIDKPHELTFDEFMVFVRLCMEDLKEYVALNEKGKEEFTPMGYLRVERYFAWVCSLAEPEWKIIASKTAMTKYKLPINPAKTPSFDTLAQQIKIFIIR